MTQSESPVDSHNFRTVSGKPLIVGTGTGTKWQWLKKGRPEEERTKLTQELIDQLLLALNNGFYHIDTAEIYTTHPEVAEAVEQSGIKREDLWITSKYNPYRNITAADALKTTLEELKTDYLDLYLIHTPFFSDESTYSIETAWKEIIDAKKQGKIRHIGVSNFAVQHLERVFKVSEPKFYPVVNQIEFHPYLQDQSADITDYCKKHNILLEAYGPLTPLFRIQSNEADTAEDPLRKVLPKLSEKYQKTDSQILLRYTLQRGYLPITTSSKVQRIRETLAIYDFELSAEDVALIDKEGSTFHFRSFFDGKFD